MPDDLKEHLRYPEDLFRVQTNVWASYHIDEADEFYRGDDRWDVALDPGTSAARVTTSSSSSTSTTVANRQRTARTTRIAPYYLFTQLPGAEEPEFILMRPFVPVSARDDNQVLTAFMVGKSDGADYGKLQVFVMPQGEQPPGPALVQGEIESDIPVSEQQTLLGGTGSNVDYGSLTAIPIDGGLVYVRPFYVTSTQAQVPALQAVIVYFDGEVAIRSTLQEALAAIFGEAPPTLEEEPTTPTDPSAPAEPTGSVTEQVTQLLIEAGSLFDQADAALAQRDLAKYQELVEEARAKTRAAEQLLAASGAAATTTTVAGASA
jgi:uncharacterized membrane protein (UPF0182 family)